MTHGGGALPCPPRAIGVEIDDGGGKLGGGAADSDGAGRAVGEEAAHPKRRRHERRRATERSEARRGDARRDERRHRHQPRRVHQTAKAADGADAARGAVCASLGGGADSRDTRGLCAPLRRAREHEPSRRQRRANLWPHARQQPPHLAPSRRVGRANVQHTVPRPPAAPCRRRRTRARPLRGSDGDGARHRQQRQLWQTRTDEGAVLLASRQRQSGVAIDGKLGALARRPLRHVALRRRRITTPMDTVGERHHLWAAVRRCLLERGEGGLCRCGRVAPPRPNEQQQ